MNGGVKGRGRGLVERYLGLGRTAWEFEVRLELDVSSWEAAHSALTGPPPNVHGGVYVLAPPSLRPPFLSSFIAYLSTFPGTNLSTHILLVRLYIAFRLKCVHYIIPLAKLRR